MQPETNTDIMDDMATRANECAGIREPDKPGFEVYNNQGFKITFDNGVTISVQFGNGNYCANDRTFAPGTLPKYGIRCDDAEIAIWTHDRKWITNEFLGRDYLGGCYDVDGYCNPETVAQAIAWAQNYNVMEDNIMNNFEIEEGSTSSDSCNLVDIVSGVSDLIPIDLLEAFNAAPGWDEQSWAFDEIFDHLNEIAPDGLMFGASEGDGACYGFWKMEDDI